MKHYIDINGVVYAYAADGSDDALIGNKTPIEGEALVAAWATAAIRAEAEIEALKQARQQ